MDYSIKNKQKFLQTLYYFAYLDEFATIQESCRSKNRFKLNLNYYREQESRLWNIVVHTPIYITDEDKLSKLVKTATDAVFRKWGHNMYSKEHRKKVKKFKKLVQPEVIKDLFPA